MFEKPTDLIIFPHIVKTFSEKNCLSRNAIVDF